MLTKQPSSSAMDWRSGLVLGCLAGWAWLAAVAGPPQAVAADWPAYLHDNARSGIAAESVRFPLHACWEFVPLHAPRPAWGDPKSGPVEGILELRRRHFDDAFQVVVAGGAAYFGSSADHKVYCLDLAKGDLRWTFITGGPIRLAPAVVDGRVYVGSDDGWVYCLSAADGSLAWRFRAAPDDQRVLGNGKMISLWPVRTGVLVDGATAYFGAGIFPAEGVFLYAVDARDGRVLWKNDACGETPQSWVSPQGYLLASATTLYAPMGRVSPGAFDRQNGQLKNLAYFGQSVGGTYAMLSGEDVYTGTEAIVGYRQTPRDRFASFPGQKIVVKGDTAFLATDSRLMALDRIAYPALSQKLESLRNSRAGLDQSQQGPRRERGEMENKQAQLHGDLDKIAKQLADEKDQQKQRDLRAKQDKLNGELATVVQSLDDWARRHGKAEETLAKLVADIQQAQSDLAAAIRWNIACDCHEALILGADTLFAGGPGRVMAVEAGSGKTVWSADVEGTTKGLAVADGRLLVSSDKGPIYCFGPGISEGDSPIFAPRKLGQSPMEAGTAAASPAVAQAAEVILKKSGVQRGFCLVLGCQTGELAVELARRSELMIYAVSPDPDKVAAVRKAVDAAGLYGARVCVEQWPLEKLPYSDYFANLIVSETAMAGTLPPNAAEMFRMLKPLGGVAVLGQPAQRPADAKPLDAAGLRQWADQAKLEGTEVSEEQGQWLTLRRGALPGAGSWTHLYANPGNTACGDDQRVRAPLGVLWFGNPGPGPMVGRHERAAGPLSIDGRLFVQGENVLMAYDAYNGIKLWERDLSGARRTNASHDGSNLALCHEALFVAVGDKCLRIDPASGETKATYQVPAAADGKSGRWGCVAYADGLLFGSRSSASTSSNCLFAVEPDTGKVRWSYEAEQIPHNTIAIDGGRVFLVQSNLSPEERQQVLSQLAEPDRAKADVRLVVALDAQTGQVRWKKPIDLAYCGGGNLSAMATRGALVLFGVYLDGHYWQQFFAGDFASRRVTVLSTEDGSLLWSKPVGYLVRPLVIGDTLHTEPWAFDLKTGEPKTRIHPVTGLADRWQYARPGHHCGGPCASTNCIFFRSLCLGYYDLAGDSGTVHFGAQRPGCWINFIPAAGLLLFPEASTGCMCPFPNMCTVVFRPAEKTKAYSYYSAPGPMTPVERLAINLGAPGDRLNAAGKLWLGYPRPAGSLVLQFPLEVTFAPGGSFVMRNAAYTPIAGTEDPWLFATAARGLVRCGIPLLTKGDGKSLYSVRLAFADPDNDQPGQRLFDVKLQGKPVLEGFDVVAAAGGRDRAVVREFTGVEVTDKLLIELVPRQSNPTPQQAPILQGVEMIREKVLGLGCDVPNFQLSTMEPKQSAELRLANLQDAPFQGTLELAAPEGLQVTPKQAAMQLAPKSRAVVPLEVTVADSLAAGNYVIRVRLVRADGSVEMEGQSAVEHLGRRGRLVLKPAEDAAVQKRYPDLNKGSATVLLVDGGNQQMGDADHAMAFLKYRLEVPGKVLKVRLRISHAGNPSGDAGRICLVTEPWSEKQITYATRPALGAELARLGSVVEGQVVERPLAVDLAGKTELSLAIDPTSCDGVDYLSRESGSPAELIIDYEPSP